MASRGCQITSDWCGACGRQDRVSGLWNMARPSGLRLGLMGEKAQATSIRVRASVSCVTSGLGREMLRTSLSGRPLWGNSEPEGCWKHQGRGLGREGLWQSTARRLHDPLGGRTPALIKMVILTHASHPSVRLFCILVFPCGETPLTHPPSVEGRREPQTLCERHWISPFLGRVWRVIEGHGCQAPHARGLSDYRRLIRGVSLSPV